MIHKKGPWSKSEEDKLINVIITKSETGDILNEDMTINWIKVSKFINGRSGKACYDKFRTIPKSYLLLAHQKNKLIYNLNPIFLASFTDYEENEMVNEILNRIDKKQPVTLFDVSLMAFKRYYSPLSIATRYLVMKSMHDGIWPFDEIGNIIIKDFDNKIIELLPTAQNEPQILMNAVYMRQFTASLSWCRNFLSRHNLSLRKPHNERLGEINAKFIKIYLKQLAKAFKKYGINGVINMDETFVHTFYYEERVVSRRNEGACEVVRGSKYNAKEGTTVIATSTRNKNKHIPLAIVAKGRSTKSENKYEIDKLNDEELILHSPNGWTNAQIMVKYLDWLAGKMPKEGFALVLDVYKSHLTKEFRQEAKKKNVQLIYVPACGTGQFQPLDISVFGVFKQKLIKYEKLHEVPNEDTKRFGFFKNMIIETWKEITQKVFDRGWNIPGFSISDSEFEYTDIEEEDSESTSDEKSLNDDPNYTMTTDDDDNL